MTTQRAITHEYMCMISAHVHAHVCHHVTPHDTTSNCELECALLALLQQTSSKYIQCDIVNVRRAAD